MPIKRSAQGARAAADAKAAKLVQLVRMRVAQPALWQVLLWLRKRVRVLVHRREAEQNGSVRGDVVAVHELRRRILARGHGHHDAVPQRLFHARLHACDAGLHCGRIPLDALLLVQTHCVERP